MKQTITKLLGGALFALLLVPSSAWAIDYPVTATWNFTSFDQIYRTTGTVASDVSGINLYVDATANNDCVLRPNGSGYAQINTATVLQIPVRSITDVVTVNAYSTLTYTLDGKSVTASATNPKTHTATMKNVADGFVELVATNNSYIDEIRVVQNDRSTTPMLMSFDANGTTYYSDELVWSTEGTTHTATMQIAGTLISSGNPLENIAAYSGSLGAVSYSGNIVTIAIDDHSFIITFTSASNRTVTYYDVDGTTSLGTQNVTSGSTIGTFAYTATPDVGYSFRGWYTAANGGGTKVTTSTVVNDDMDIFAYQTETETYGPNKSYTFDLRTILNASYFDDHEAISISGGTRHGAQHGWYFWNSQPISILVAGNSKISIGLCSYSPNQKITITYPNGTTDECDADPDGDDNNKDGEEHTFVYSGGTSGVATIACSSSYVYIHQIKIDNEYGIITVGSAGWSTYITNEDVNFSGVTAYIVSAKDTETATLTSVASAPAGTPVIIRADEGEYILTSEASPADVSSNKLQKATTEITADGTQYILANAGNGIGFYPATVDSKISAGKAYLSSSVSGHALTLNFDNGTTGINEVANQKSLFVGTCYNLAGQRVAAPAKGLYIVNGKKVIIK